MSMLVDSLTRSVNVQQNSPGYLNDPIVPRPSVRAIMTQEADLAKTLQAKKLKKIGLNPLQAQGTSTVVRVVMITMDTHLNSATQRAKETIAQLAPFIHLQIFSASEYEHNTDQLARTCEAIRSADVIFVSMLFMEDHFKPVLNALIERRAQCDAMVCIMSAQEIVQLTKMGRLDMSKPSTGPLAYLKKLRGEKKRDASTGERQMKMLRRLPKLLRFIPGTAQDLRVYFLCMQYWIGGSQENILNMALMLCQRYTQGERKKASERLRAELPIEYPELGVYHPRMKPRIASGVSQLPTTVPKARAKGRVGVLMLRSYLLASNTQHYDAVIAALEVEGLQVIPAFAYGLDARPAIEAFFINDGVPCVDAVISLTGFSLVGGPAYNDSRAAEEVLAKLDVPYLAAHPVEFQTLDQWGSSERGLMPVESTIMIAIPELDGAVVPMVFGGRPGPEGVTCTGCDKRCTFTKEHVQEDMFTCTERTSMLAKRVGKLVDLRRSERAERKVAMVLFNFPPNAGNTGTAAYLGVFESLFNLLNTMKDGGYRVDVPGTVDQLREEILHGNAQLYGADANVHTVIPVADHIKRERHLKEIEAHWGPAPGKQLTNGSGLFVIGKQYGNVLVCVQPSFGYEGDPMRLLFEKGFAPTHAFSAFYRYLREDFQAKAVLHFGTHGALEFMPGKQTGLTGNCWPDRLIADLPNFYLYASNNPSEGAIAKRRSGATLVSYLTSPVAESGLYSGLMDLKASIERFRSLSKDQPSERVQLALLIQAQAGALDLCALTPIWEVDPCPRDLRSDPTELQILRMQQEILELEYTLIPQGLHVLGVPYNERERADMIGVMAESVFEQKLPDACIQSIVASKSTAEVLSASGLLNHQKKDVAPSHAGVPTSLSKEQITQELEKLLRTNAHLSENKELEAILKALDARYIRPAPGGDLIRSPEVLPTGRNLHGFDPFKIPSLFAVMDGAAQAEKILARHQSEGNPLPESIAVVLWGSDNLKSEGAQIGQVLRMMGAKPRFDSYSRLVGASLIPLSELGRPRVDVVVTLSGIFRDLMPMQIKLLAEAAYLCACADEPIEQNYIRKHALQYQAEHGCDLQTAALRVFGNADGAYGSNVNHMIDSGNWDNEDELANTYSSRKGFAFGITGKPAQNPGILKSALADVELTYQNMDSVELGVTTVDNYFDTLGGITKAVEIAKGGTKIPVYIGDQTNGEGKVRTLMEQVSIETRTRLLNPKFYESLLKHGYEGVRQIEVHITNTMGWSATTGQVQPWVYKQFSETFVLNAELRTRMAELNPSASLRMANRLLEASQRNYWQPDPKMLEELKRASEELEDRLEGVFEPSSA